MTEIKMIDLFDANAPRVAEWLVNCDDIKALQDFKNRIHLTFKRLECIYVNAKIGCELDDDLKNTLEICNKCIDDLTKKNECNDAKIELKKIMFGGTE